MCVYIAASQISARFKVLRVRWRKSGVQRHPAIHPCGLRQCEGVLAVCSAASDSLQGLYFRANSTAAAPGITT